MKEKCYLQAFNYCAETAVQCTFMLENVNKLAVRFVQLVTNLQAMLCYVVSCRVVSCPVLSCHVMLCYIAKNLFLLLLSRFPPFLAIPI